MSTLFSFFHNYSYPASISLFFFFNDTATTEIYTYLTHSFPTRRSSDLRHIAVIDAAEFRTLAVIDADLVRGEGRFVGARSEEHTSELQSLMRISYAVFCLKKKKRYKLNTLFLEKLHKI